MPKNITFFVFFRENETNTHETAKKSLFLTRDPKKSPYFEWSQIIDPNKVSTFLIRPK